VCMREQSAREGPWKRVTAAAAKAGIEAPRIMRLLVQLREKEKHEVDPKKKKALAATMAILRRRRNFVLRAEVAVRSFERQVEDILSAKTQAELTDEDKFMSEDGMQPVEMSLEDRAGRVASDIQKAKDHLQAKKAAKEAKLLAKKAARETKIQAARDEKKGNARKTKSKVDRAIDHSEQLHELSKTSKKSLPPSHPFQSLSEQTQSTGLNKSADGSKVLLLSRQWQLLVARAVAYAVDVEPQPLEEEDLKKDYMVQLFWDNLVDRKHANYWPDNTEHLWMGPRMKRLQYVASLPGDMLKTVKQWRGEAEVLEANEGMDDHVKVLSGGSEKARAMSSEQYAADEDRKLEPAKPTVWSGLVSRFRGKPAQKDVVTTSA
jgi:hypothetical protein